MRNVKIRMESLSGMAFSGMTWAGMVMVLAALTSCSTAGQPNWAAEHVASRNQAIVALNKRTFLFKPFNKYDSRLDLEMVRVSDDGTLVMKSQFGFESIMPGKQIAYGSTFLKLLDSDPAAQTAVLESWPRL